MRTAREVRPRVQLHRGTVVAAAFWFDPALLGEREARRRVLAQWVPGASVSEVAGGLLLRLLQPRAVACSQAPGLPLTLEDGLLTSAPLRAVERSRLAAPAGTAVLVRAGRAEVHPLDGSRRVDVSAWLDVSGWRAVEVEGLGAPPPPVAVLEPVAAPVRARFGPGIPVLAPEAEAMLARMEGRPVPVAPTAAPAAQQRSQLSRVAAWFSRGSAPAASASGTSSFLSVVGRMLAALFGGASVGASPGTASASSSSARPRTPPPPPPGPGLLSRLSEWALRSTPLGRLVGQRKAQYVRRLFELFEEGNLQEALRYAIPLNKAVSEQARVALGLPGPRERLSINLQRGGGAARTLFGDGPAVFEALEERYRAAVQRLEREGKIEEAAFVLTELLGAHEEAVSFLERHGKPRLAAELAEARGLPLGLVVRQWFLAKDVARAVALARRGGAFSEAVARLERQNNLPEARALRLLWAETLAEMGDYALAVDVVWPVPEARGLARAWLERGAALGGVGGARTLARLVLAFPEHFEAGKGRVLELLADESRERAPERAAFAEALGAEPSSGPRTALAGPVVRSLLRDKAAGRVRHLPSGLPVLLRDPGLGMLRADLPTGAERVDGRASTPWSAVLVEHLSAAEAGAFAVHDAVPLPGGRLLVALGEAGARLLRPDGTVLAHFDVPAFRLVPSVHGDRALAVAPRGELRRISRLDLCTRRAEPWCEARVDAFAPSYDGNLWFVSEGPTVLAVDALARDWRALWRVAQVGQEVLAVVQDGVQLSFLAADGLSHAEVWTYVLAGGPTLRSRHSVRNEDGFAHAVLLADGTVEFGEGLLRGNGWRVQLTGMRGVRYEACLAQQVAVVRARIVFEGPQPPQGRFWGRELVLFDAAGRLARVDLAEGTVRRLRVL